VNTTRAPQRDEVEEWLGPVRDRLSNDDVAAIHLRIVAWHHEHPDASHVEAGIAWMDCLEESAR